MLKEFKAFVMRGNVVDLAVGVIIGAAFGKVVTSLVNDVLMPPIGALMGGANFSNLVLVVKEGNGGAKPVTLNYGAFIATVVDFLIVALAIFLIVKGFNSLKKQSPPPAPSETTCPQCLMLIPIAAKKCGHCSSDL